MKKAADPTSELQELRKIPANKRCFDCNQAGTTYAIPELGIFLCSICGGIHREFNHRVKGLSTCNFNEAEVNKLKNMGNERAAGIWMARHDTRAFPVPDLKDGTRLKEFLRLKYVEKRFYENKEVTPQGEAKTPVERKVEPPQAGGFINLLEDDAPKVSSGERNVQNYFPASFGGAKTPVQMFPPPPVPSQNSTPVLTGPSNTNSMKHLAAPIGQQVTSISQQVSPPSQNFTPAPQTFSQPVQLSPQPSGNQPAFPPTQNAFMPFPPNPQPPNAFQPFPAVFPTNFSQPGNYSQPNYSQPNFIQAGNYTQPPNYSQQPQNFIQYNPANYSQPAPGYSQQMSPGFSAFPAGLAYPNGQKHSPPVMPSGQQHFFANAVDPFGQILEEEMEKKKMAAQQKSNMNSAQQLMLQQYNVQTQIYLKNYGVPYPYTFQQWVSMNNPQGLQETRAHSKNPFDMF